jgi:hypothetical protein
MAIRLMAQSGERLPIGDSRSRSVSSTFPHRRVLPLRLGCQPEQSILPLRSAQLSGRRMERRLHGYALGATIAVVGRQRNES